MRPSEVNIAILQPSTNETMSQTTTPSRKDDTISLTPSTDPPFQQGDVESMGPSLPTNGETQQMLDTTTDQLLTQSYVVDANSLGLVPSSSIPHTILIYPDPSDGSYELEAPMAKSKAEVPGPTSVDISVPSATSSNFDNRTHDDSKSQSSTSNLYEPKKWPLWPPCIDIKRTKIVLDPSKRTAHPWGAFVKDAFPCSDCDKKFSNAPTLMTHMRDHAGDVFLCECCEKQFTVSIQAFICVTKSRDIMCHCYGPVTHHK